MTEEYALYKAVLQLKKAAEENAELRSLAEAVSAAQGDEVEVSAVSAQTDCAWIETVSSGLDSIGRAIEEERRFIRSNGEVQPIEKIKRVSKESVQHLARHGDYINAERGRDEIVPEKLFSVERLNDYATYENRFLYTLLCMVKEYVARKLSCILRANSYEGKLSVHKTVNYGGRTLSVNLELKDKREGCAFSDKGDNVHKIEQLQQSIDFYLRTPLMLEVSKSDKIQSLTLTNILRMDKYFRESVALYEFILSDSEEKPNTSEHKGQTADGFELAFPALMYAFLAYEQGLGLKDELKEKYFEEEQKELSEKKKALQGRLGGADAEKYVRLLEEQNDGLIREVKRLISACRQADGQAARIEELERQLNEEKFKAERIISEHETAVKEMEAEFAIQTGETSALLREQEENFQKLRAEMDGLVVELAEARAEKQILEARFTALMAQCGQIKEGEFRSEDALNSLEKQYETLGRLLRREWKGVKKALRGQFYSDVKAQIFKKKDKSDLSNTHEESATDE